MTVYMYNSETLVNFIPECRPDERGGRELFPGTPTYMSEKWFNHLIVGLKREELGMMIKEMYRMRIG